MSNFLGDLWSNTAGGLLWKPIKKATGLTDAQMIGLGAAAVAAPFALPALGASGAAGAAGGATAGAAPIADLSVQATPQMLQGASQSFGGGGLLSTAASYGKPAMTALQGASMAKGLLGQQQPIQGAQLNKQAPQFSGLLTQPQDQEALRRQQYQQYVQNIGGRNGLAY